MKGKLTLITPPDIFENENIGILFVNLEPADQDSASLWLSQQDIDTDINLYVYSGELEFDWLFYAMNVCGHKYINLNSLNTVTNSIVGYMLGKNNVYYRTDDPVLIDLYSRINSNRVNNIETFLESTLSVYKTNKPSM